MRFRAPIPEAILADNFSICSFQDRVSSISTPSYFAHETCFKHHILIDRDHSGRGSLESLKSLPGANQHKLCLGCIQSQLVSNE